MEYYPLHTAEYATVILASDWLYCSKYGINTSYAMFSSGIHTLISRVRGPYGKLWTKFFSSFYGPSAKRAGHENKEGKIRGFITCLTDRANEANKMFIIWLC